MASLITKAIEKKLEKFPFRSQEEKGNEAKILVKFFNPYGKGTWYVTEAEKQEDGDWLFYGKAEIDVLEWGYFSLRELESVRIGSFQLKLERDKYFEGKIKDIK